MNGCYILFHALYLLTESSGGQAGGDIFLEMGEEVWNEEQSEGGPVRNHHRILKEN